MSDHHVNSEEPFEFESLEEQDYAEFLNDATETQQPYHYPRPRPPYHYPRPRPRPRPYYPYYPYPPYYPYYPYYPGYDYGYGYGDDRRDRRGYDWGSE
ncbi:hypothetical protein [Domibacillus epiphyticus]|uniref:hypothetical protein n=1 Tax=Domibacillus epiphyticus TaxID=1714355 RepID=UPI0018E9C77B|nr:hypothetical protein [Domibacillus epiphyticus]